VVAYEDPAACFEPSVRSQIARDALIYTSTVANKRLSDALRAVACNRTHQSAVGNFVARRPRAHLAPLATFGVQALFRLIAALTHAGFSPMHLLAEPIGRCYQTSIMLPKDEQPREWTKIEESD
jgi:hypothetical protein